MIEIKNLAGTVLWTVDSDTLRGVYLRGANLGGANLGGANLRKANLGGADLRWADLGGANLGGANLGGADLSGANLRGADLGGADLRWADLRWADLSGANLGEGLKPVVGIAGRAARLDGYEFVLWRLEKGAHAIRAGCRTLTLAGYREHVAASYPGTPKAVETLRLLDYLEACLETRADA